VDGKDAGIVNLGRVIVPERFGSRLKLLTVTALVIKFTKILILKVKDLGNPESKCLSGKDLRSAEELWVKSVQQRVFPNEYHDLLPEAAMYIYSYWILQLSSHTCVYLHYSYHQKSGTLHLACDHFQEIVHHVNSMLLPMLLNFTIPASVFTVNH